MGIYSQFCEKRSVLFSTDVASRGLDFAKAVDWVVQVDCPEDVAAYIHRVGRTARYQSGGRSVLFLMPSEMKMLDKLRDRKIPIRFIKANTKRLEPVSGLLSALLVKYPNLQYLAQRAFITYLKSVYKQRDKEVFDVMKLQIDDYSASLGLPMTPNIRFLKQKVKGKISEELSILPETTSKEDIEETDQDQLITSNLKGGEMEMETEMGKDLLLQKESLNEEKGIDMGNTVPATRILKKKKLKINVHRPVGTRVVFDEEGNTLPPLAQLADIKSSSNLVQLDQDKVKQRYDQLRKELKMVDEEDKVLDRERRREKRVKEKVKRQRGQKGKESDSESGDILSDSYREERQERPNKKGKIYFDSDSDVGDDTRARDEKGLRANSVTLAEQEELALKLLSSMH